MFNYILKRFKKIVIRILSLLFFLLFLLMVFLYLNYRLNNKYPNPNYIYSYVKENKTDTYLNKKNTAFLQEKDIWAIRLDKDGNLIESFNKPKELKNNFDIRDVARFTRYYLADYPVFTYVLDDGLIVFAYPKHSLDKLPSNYYSYSKFIFNIILVLVFVILFLLFVYVLYKLDIKNILKNILPLQRAIDKLYEDDYEKLDEYGELKDLMATINEANEKYKNLKKSQCKWIRGVSHDVRTPLAKISWEVNKENPDKKLIQDEVLKISNILEGLNLTISLSNIDKENFTCENPLKIIRKLIVDKLNENPDRDITFENNIENQDIKIKLDENLFYRMLENILKNALTYTSGKIKVVLNESKDMISITISDEGCGLSEDIIRRINEEDMTNITRHGLGLFISKQIAELHDAEFIINNKNPGLEVSFVFKGRSQF